MLERIGLRLANAGRHDDAIETFGRAVQLGWNVVPDGRSEIARVLLLAGRHDEADALWSQLRAADPESDGVWTLNAGGFACEDDDRAARERWPEWTAGVWVDGTFAERAARTERALAMSPAAEAAA